MIGRRYVNDHAGIEAGFEAVFQIIDEIWMFIRGKYKLAVGIGKSIEKMKQFFLKFFLTAEELDVIHVDDVVFSVFFFEFLSGVGLERRKILGTESFRSE